MAQPSLSPGPSQTLSLSLGLHQVDWIKLVRETGRERSEGQLEQVQHHRHRHRTLALSHPHALTPSHPRAPAPLTLSLAHPVFFQVLTDLGQIPPPEKPSARALWVAGLINPLPALGVALEIRPAVLTAASVQARLRAARLGLEDSIARLQR